MCNLLMLWWNRLHTSAVNYVHPSDLFCLVPPHILFLFARSPNVRKMLLHYSNILLKPMPIKNLNMMLIFFVVENVVLPLEEYSMFLFFHFITLFSFTAWTSMSDICTINVFQHCWRWITFNSNRQCILCICSVCSKFVQNTFGVVWILKIIKFAIAGQLWPPYS